MRRSTPALRLFAWLAALFMLGAVLWDRAGEAAGALPSQAGLLRISVLDIGQGDSIVIQAPGGRSAIIDAGPAANQSLLINQLTRLGITQIDLAVESHPHEDHIGGFPALLDRFTVRNFTDPGTPHTTANYQALLMKLKEKKVPTRVARKGQKYKLDDKVFLEVLAPREPLFSGTNSDLNNNSTSVRLTFQDFSMLFIGDSEADAESRLVEDGVPPTTVLKVGHHGSRSSSTSAFVDRVNPQAAVLSCEVGNDYGHPHKKTLDTYGKRSIPLYRTDQDGQVRFMTDGHRFWVATFSRNSLTAGQPDGDPAPAKVDGPFPVRPAAGSSQAPVTQAAPASTQPGPTQPAPASDTRTTSREVAPDSSQGSNATPSEDGYIASQKSKVFHKASCPAGKKIVEHNRVYFATREEAIAAGKEPAKDCKP
jgi:beta-lactamase superfamily II metal-dependent hydrolase